MNDIGGFEWNSVYYIDCLEGLRKLPDKSIDLSLTDPPYNVEVGRLAEDFKRFHDGFERNGHKGKFYINKDFFNDVNPDYNKWCIEWLKELERISERIVFTPGNKNLHLWLDYKEPKEILIHYKKNCISITHRIRFLQHDYILAYGKFKPFEFRSSVFDIPLDNSYIHKIGLVHPTIKEIKLWRSIVERLKPESILDPFMGSGTSAQVALENGIPFIGFEKESKYKIDINKRIALGKMIFEEKNQITSRDIK